jgi:hypothetical protein
VTEPTQEPQPAASAEQPQPAAQPASPPQPAQFGGSTPSEQAQAALAATDQGGYVSAKPLLVTGTAGRLVAELAHLLHLSGYVNKVAAGLVPAVLDDELMRIVREFQADHGIDPAAPQGDAPPLVRKDHAGLVEAATWALLYELAGDVQSHALKLEAKDVIAA